MRIAVLQRKHYVSKAQFGATRDLIYNHRHVVNPDDQAFVMRVLEGSDEAPPAGFWERTADESAEGSFTLDMTLVGKMRVILPYKLKIKSWRKTSKSKGGKQNGYRCITQKIPVDGGR